MTSKYSLLSRAALIAGTVALALPAFAAETSPPAAPAKSAAPVTGKTSTTAEQKTDKMHAKKHARVAKNTVTSDTHKPAPAVPATKPADVSTNPSK